MAAFMMTPSLGYRLKVLLLVSGLLLPCLQPSESIAAGYGSLAGVVSDNKGVPLMGATRDGDRTHGLCHRSRQPDR